MSKQPSAFQGELKEAILPSLLRYMEQQNMTGKLQLDHVSGNQGMIWVAAGKVVAARTTGQQGQVQQLTQDEAELKSPGMKFLRELSSWHEGRYRFTPGNMADERTIQLSLDDILAQLYPHNTESGKTTVELDPSVVCIKRNTSSERFNTLSIEFQQLDLTVFLEIDGERSIEQIADSLKLPLSRVYHVIERLLKYQLISRVS